ncbi:MAG: SMC-Scp complex subunit ScpB [Eubacteriales bacterium]|nr:SMC-Scp complex subunit ScpB [Eubacteriales bacterium]
MNPTQLDAALEAVLFASGSPVSLEKLSEIFCTDKTETADSAARVANRLEDGGHGIELIFVDGSYQLCTKACFAEHVKKALELRKTPPLTKASLEVLAVVSYNQPVTKSFIETIRGVDSDGIVNSLCDKGLIRECGHLDAPGRPTLFGTTESFLRCFGLESISRLPKIDLEEQITLLPDDMELTAKGQL